MPLIRKWQPGSKPVLTSAVSKDRRSFWFFELFLFVELTFLLDAKGQSANMLKISSKRRRTMAQIRADKEAEAQKEAENDGCSDRT